MNLFLILLLIDVLSEASSGNGSLISLSDGLLAVHNKLFFLEIKLQALDVSLMKKMVAALS